MLNTLLQLVLSLLQEPEIIKDFYKLRADLEAKVPLTRAGASSKAAKVLALPDFEKFGNKIVANDFVSRHLVSTDFVYLVLSKFMVGEAIGLTSLKVEVPALIA